MKKLYIVTGAAGLLGSTIVRELVKKDVEVRVFVLPNDKTVRYLPEGIKIYKGDLRDIATIEPIFQDINEAVVYCLHIASIVSLEEEYNQLVMDVNVLGTKNIISFCSKYNVKRLVYCSSTGAIPELKKPKQIVEVNSFDESKVLGCYSKSKALASQEVLNAVKAKKVNAVIVHPSGILGLGDYAIGETTKSVIDIINGKLKVGINGSFNLCDVRDLATATIASAKKGKNGECYILANDEVTFKNFVKLISKVANKKPVKLFLPIWFAKIIAKKMEKNAKKTCEAPLLNSFAVYNLERNNNFPSDKAKHDLGYKTRDYKETLVDEVNWLKEQKLI